MNGIEKKEQLNTRRGIIEKSLFARRESCIQMGQDSVYSIFATKLLLQNLEDKRKDPKKENNRV